MEGNLLLNKNIMEDIFGNYFPAKNFKHKHIKIEPFLKDLSQDSLENYLNLVWKKIYPLDGNIENELNILCLNEPDRFEVNFLEEGILYGITTIKVPNTDYYVIKSIPEGFMNKEIDSGEIGGISKESRLSHNQAERIYATINDLDSFLKKRDSWRNLFF